MRNLYLIRGLPGSGKSTLAATLVGGCDGVEISADLYFVNPEGYYQFDPARLAEAHAWAQNEVLAAMKKGQSPIAVANTFTQRWEMGPYYRMAHELGYFVTEITVETLLSDEALAARNIHGVPASSIARMRARWEK